MAKKPQSSEAEAPAASEQPYYLQRAHIKDFRSIRDAKVEFKPGLNIIIGPNGSGKTNFVSGVVEALDISNPLIEQVPWGEFIIAGRRILRITCRRIEPEDSQLRKDSRFAGLFIEHSTNVEISTSYHQSSGSSLAEAVANNSSLISESNLFQPILVSYGVPNYYSIAENLIIKQSNNEGNWWSENGLSKLVTRIITENIVASNVGFGETFNREVILETIQEVIEFYINKLKGYLAKYSPIQDIRFASSTQVYKNSFRDEIKVAGISLDYKVNGDWLPFDELSSGTQRMVYLIFEVVQPDDYFLSRRGIHDYASSDDRIIFIEEPELGIHPDQLHKLLLFLREQSEKHQIIITTHSPQVLDMLREDELDRITICELDEKKGTQFRKLTKAKVAAAKKFMQTTGYLSDYWLYSSLEKN